MKESIPEARPVVDKSFGAMVDPDSNEARLWRMLDNIDALSDAIKPVGLQGYKNFYLAAMKQASKRCEILHSDGYNLYEINDDEC